MSANQSPSLNAPLDQSQELPLQNLEASLVETQTQDQPQELQASPIMETQETLPLSNLKTNTALRNTIHPEMSVGNMTYITKNKCDYYSILRIKKRDGTDRVLHSPNQEMRKLQYGILTKILNTLPVPDYVHAFEKGKNIPDMAKLHVGKLCVVSLDIKDYFHSITQRMVHKVLVEYGMSEYPARALSELCTYKAFVPQGALTSPKVANLITANTFGPEVKRYCDSIGATVTIYADDITVSYTDPDIVPMDIVRTVTELVTDNGFKINRKKTKIMYKGGRQYVCGTVVNTKVNLILAERNKLRAIVHNTVKNGLVSEAAKTQVDPSKFLNNLRGRLNWFTQLNPEKGIKYSKQLKSYLQVVKKETKDKEDVAFLYKEYMAEIEKTLNDEPENLPW